MAFLCAHTFALPSEHIPHAVAANVGDDVGVWQHYGSGQAAFYRSDHAAVGGCAFLSALSLLCCGGVCLVLGLRPC